MTRAGGEGLWELRQGGRTVRPRGRRGACSTTRSACAWRPAAADAPGSAPGAATTRPAARTWIGRRSRGRRAGGRRLGLDSAAGAQAAQFAEAVPAAAIRPCASVAWRLGCRTRHASAAARPNTLGEAFATAEGAIVPRRPGSGGSGRTRAGRRGAVPAPAGRARPGSAPTHTAAHPARAAVYRPLGAGRPAAGRWRRSAGTARRLSAGRCHVSRAGRRTHRVGTATAATTPGWNATPRRWTTGRRNEARSPDRRREDLAEQCIEDGDLGARRTARGSGRAARRRPGVRLAAELESAAAGQARAACEQAEQARAGAATWTRAAALGARRYRRRPGYWVPGRRHRAGPPSDLAAVAADLAAPEASVAPRPAVDRRAGADFGLDALAGPAAAQAARPPGRTVCGRAQADGSPSGPITPAAMRPGPHRARPPGRRSTVLRTLSPGGAEGRLRTWVLAGRSAAPRATPSGRDKRASTGAMAGCQSPAEASAPAVSQAGVDLEVGDRGERPHQAAQGPRGQAEQRRPGRRRLARDSRFSRLVPRPAAAQPHSHGAPGRRSPPPDGREPVVGEPPRRGTGPPGSVARRGRLARRPGSSTWRRGRRRRRLRPHWRGGGAGRRCRRRPPGRRVPQPAMGRHSGSEEGRRRHRPATGRRAMARVSGAECPRSEVDGRSVP